MFVCCRTTRAPGQARQEREERRSWRVRPSGEYHTLTCIILIRNKDSVVVNIKQYGRYKSFKIIKTKQKLYLVYKFIIVSTISNVFLYCSNTANAIQPCFNIVVVILIWTVSVYWKNVIGQQIQYFFKQY